MSSRLRIFADENIPLQSIEVRKLEYINLAVGLDDLAVPPSNRLHKLKEDRAGQYSISVNDQWRIYFRFVDGDAFDVELTDYH